MALPGRQPDVNKLRHNYIDALNKYEGTKYIWGGENRLGIDCSGLLRSGLILADYEQGLRTGNPALVRDGFSLWWHDCSARALGEEYRHQTRLLFSAGSINAIDDSMLLPGDIAVTRSGVHTLAYLGDRVWIEAEPNAGKVIHVTAPVHDPWFEEPVNILRWSQLDQTNSGR